MSFEYRGWCYQLGGEVLPNVDQCVSKMLIRNEPLYKFIFEPFVSRCVPPHKQISNPEITSLLSDMMSQPGHHGRDIQTGQGGRERPDVKVKIIH